MKKMIMVLLVLSLAILATTAVLAAEPSDAQVTNEADLGEYVFSSTDADVTVDSGNITYADLNTNLSTYRWAGLLGNVSGNVVLADSSDNYMFNWASAGLLVYASTAAAPVWSTLADVTVANMPAFLTGTSSDNYTETFTGASESIGSNMFTISSDFATTQSTGATVWKTYSLWDTTNLVWAGKVVDDGTSYSGTTVDYQMILPSDDTATTYNLWVELE
jgi:hypothetical protein